MVGYSHTNYVVRGYRTTRPSGAKVELSVQDASVPPTGVRPSHTHTHARAVPEGGEGGGGFQCFPPSAITSAHSPNGPACTVVRLSVLVVS